MTPEERAADLNLSLSDAESTRYWTARIAGAIRAAEHDVLERAATKCEEFVRERASQERRFFDVDGDGSRRAEWVGCKRSEAERCVAAIRRMKESA
jgi:hypothetical protein